MAAAASNTLIERLILKHAKPFVSNLELSVNLGAGEVLIRNITLREGEGFFSAVDKFLREHKIDVWGANGTPMVFPTGIEIESGSIKEARVQIPVPNPFNGENWLITVDGIEGVVRTLPASRREELLRQAKKKGLEEASKRLKNAARESSKLSVEQLERLVSTESAPEMSNDEDVETIDASSEAGDMGNQQSSTPGNNGEPEVWTDMITGRWKRVQKRIDRYFREHMAISFRSAKVALLFAEHPIPGLEDARWDFDVGECRLDLGIGQKVLPTCLAKAVQRAPMYQSLEPPLGRKVWEEIIGVGFRTVHVAMRPGPGMPPVAELDFPEECFTLNHVKRQWEEKDTTKSNGAEHIHVDLGDAFSVELQLKHTELRGVIIHMLHQIFDGVSSAVPDFADWLTVPCEDGWTREGKQTPQKEDEEALIQEYCDLVREAYVYDTSGGIQKSSSLDPGLDSRSGNNNNNNNNFFWPFSKLFCCSMPRLGVDLGASAELPGGRLEWFELTQTTEWLAYWKFRTLFPDAAAALLSRVTTGSMKRMPTDGTVAREFARHSMPPKTGAPLDTWRVWPWRRFETTLAFTTSFEVSLGLGDGQKNILNIGFPPGMHMSMVRDLPAEWEIWMTLPGLTIETEDAPWFALTGVSATIAWGRRDMLPAQVKVCVPHDVPSVTRIMGTRVGPLSVFMCPKILRALMPLLAELPHVLAWPELWYLWGEWGYMKRPMAYMVDKVEVSRVIMNISNQDEDSEVPTGSINKITSGKGLGSVNASVHVSIKALSLTSDNECIYVDTAWQPWWKLRISVGDSNISAWLMHRPLHLLSYANVQISTTRRIVQDDTSSGFASEGGRAQRQNSSNPARQPVQVTVNVKAQEARVQVAPKMIQVGRMLAVAYEKSCKERLMPAVYRIQDAIKSFQRFADQCKVTCDWLWPTELLVRCEDLDHLEVLVQHSVAGCVRIRPCFRLQALLQNPLLDEQTPLLKLEMDRAGVEVEVLDDSQSQSWEPLLEPWGFHIKSEFFLPPEPRLRFELSGCRRPKFLGRGTHVGAGCKDGGTASSGDESKADPLHLTVSSTVIRVGKELALAWYTEVAVLISGRWRQAPAATGACITALNLCPMPVTASVRTLPQDVQEVVVKLQSIFRGRKSRSMDKVGPKKVGDLNRLVSEPGRNLSAPQSASVGCSPTNKKKGVVGFMNLPRFRPPTEHQLSMLVLAPSKPHKLLVEETQRLSLNFNGVPRTLGGGSDDCLSVRKEKSKIAQSTNFLRNLVACGSSKQRTSNRISGRGSGSSVGIAAASRVESQSSSGGAVEQVDSALMDVCRNGHTKLVPALGGALSVDPIRAYICEVVSPTPNDRMLLIHSPIRVFNYTDHTLQIGFFNGEELDPVPEGMPESCTGSAQSLGSAQPVFSLIYGLKPPEVINATVLSGAWVLESKCFASIPPELRTSSGHVNIRMRHMTCKHWKCRTVHTATAEQNDIVYYQLAESNDAVRVLLRKSRRVASAVVTNTGPPVECWDIIILPCFSMASIHPTVLEVQINIGNEQMVVELARATIQNYYTLSSHLAERKPLRLKIRTKGSSAWSAPIKVCYERMHHEQGVAPLDEIVKLPVSDNMASTEVIVRHADVAVIIPPVWLCDKTGLGLKCTDKSGREFPKAENYYLLDTSMGDNFLSLQFGESGETAQVAMSPTIQSNAAERLMLTASESTRRRKSWDFSMFPLAIETQSLGQMSGKLRGPPMQVLTVRPGVMIMTDTPLLLRQPGHENTETPVPADKLTPVWFKAGLSPLCMVQVKLSEPPTEWSGKVICDPGVAGVHSLALPVEGAAGASSQEANGGTPSAMMSSWFWTRPSVDSSTPHQRKGSSSPLPSLVGKVLSVEVCDNQEAVVVVTISTKKPSLIVANNTELVETVGIETDAPGLPSKPSAPPPLASLRATVPSTASRASLASSNAKAGEPLSRSTKDLNGFQAQCFTCDSGEEVSVGWFEPFAKGVQTHRIRLWLTLKDGNHVCGPIDADLYSAWSYFLMMPEGLHGEEMLVINFRQGDRCYNVTVDTEPSQLKRGHQAVCGGCGSFIQAESLKGLSRRGSYMCSRCKVMLFIPGDKPSVLAEVDTAASRRKGTLKTLGLLEIIDKGSGPFAKLLSMKDLWGLTVLDLNMNISTVGISLVSKRSESEVAYVVVDDIIMGVKAPEGVLNTHVYHMSIHDVRCDGMFEKKSRTPAIFASTPIEDIDAPAVSMSVVRPFVTAQAICLKEVQAKFGACFEVSVDTEILNALLDFRDECMVALGDIEEIFIERHEFEDGDSEKCMEHIEAVMANHALAEHLLSEKRPVIVQLEALKVSVIEARLWVHLQPMKMAFVPVSVARLMQLLTLSDQVELVGATVQVKPVEVEPRRGIIADIGRSVLMAYLPQLVATGAKLLGASNLTRFATTVPTALSHVVLRSSDAMLSAITLGHGETVKSSTRKALGLRPPRKGTSEPSWSGEARLREPRLIFANARITLYNALHAELLARIGQEMLRKTLHVFVVAEDPVLAIVVRTDALLGCSFYPWVMNPDKGLSKDKQVDSKCNDHQLLGPWPWKQVLGLEALPDGRLELSLRGEREQQQAKMYWPRRDCECVFKEKAELRLACSIVSRMVRSHVYTNLSV